jgi:hypothetical protein
MSLRACLLAATTLAVGGCSKSAEQSAGPRPAPISNVTNARVAELSFVPREISAQLADANTLIAVDVGRLGISKLAALVEAELPCAGQLLRGAGVFVVGEGEGYVTQISETTARDCIDQLAPMFGATLEGNELVIGGDRYSLTFAGNTLHVVKPGGAGAAKLSAAQRARVAKIPATARGWVVSNGYPKHKIKQSLLWIEPEQTAWRLTVDAEGTEVGSARPWVAGIIDGFTRGASQKGVQVDPTWFTLTSTDTTAKLVAVIPTSIFDRVAP